MSPTGRLRLCPRGARWAVLAVVAASLQGCSVDIPRHSIGNWQVKKSYIHGFSVTPPGSSGGPVLNSCTQTHLDVSLQCSGHGQCKTWFDAVPLYSNRTTPEGPSFCLCDRDWTGPECDVQRKSQLTAFFLSMFFGMFGADMFYLGWVGLGVAKFFTLGGLGVWWVYDAARIGSSPVMTPDSFRVAADVEHWLFVLCFITFSLLVAFTLTIWSVNREQARKAREIFMLRAEGMAAAGGYGTLPFGMKQYP